MDLARIPVGVAPPEDINIVVEIPRGGEPVKYEIDKVSGAVFVDRFLHTAMFYPGNYGFVPHTLAEDGDPLDALIVGGSSGCARRHRPLPSGRRHIDGGRGPPGRKDHRGSGRCAASVLYRRALVPGST